MKSDRRKFLKQLGISAGVITTGLPALSVSINPAEAGFSKEKKSKSFFNMCGYAAPKIDTVRIGVIGLGMRGSDAVERLSYLDGVEIVALCDKYPDRVAPLKHPQQKVDTTRIGARTPNRKQSV